jgi:ABC-type lipoprotein export system ATPase subunit
MLHASKVLNDTNQNKVSAGHRAKNHAREFMQIPAYLNFLSHLEIFNNIILKRIIKKFQQEIDDTTLWNKNKNRLLDTRLSVLSQALGQ